MTTGAIAAVVFITLIVSLVLTVPIGFSLGIASLAYIFATDQLTLGFVARNMVTGTDSFPIMAIPFFVFAGELMGGGGISKRLLDVANVFFGRIRGGLAIVTVVVCMFFAAISGSGPATVAAVGGMVVPTMLEKGYDKKFVLALIAAAGSIGVIIPPSIPMVVYSVTVNSSVSSLFLAGFIPGILIGLVLIAYSYFYARSAGYKGDTEPFSIGHALREVWRGKWALLSPVIILGGIYGGIFTPTEAAAVSVVYGLFVGMVIYREVSIRDMFDILVDSAKTTGGIMLIVASASLFSFVCTKFGIADAASNLLGSIAHNQFTFLLIVNIIFLIAGCFIDANSAMYIFIPVMLPVCKPIIAVLALWSFVGMWNSYFDAMIYLNDANLQPLQLVLRSILVQNTPQPGMIADIQSTAEMAKIAEQLKYATIVVSSLPLLVMYPFFQKYFDKGIMVGSVKG